MIVIVGAGIAGLSLGYELSRRSQSITILEASTIASGASGVATSYLEPRLGNTAIRAVEWEALACWPDYAGGLQDSTGISVGFRNDGQIKVALTGDLKELQRDLSLREHQGRAFERLSIEEIRKTEPSLSHEIVAGAHLPEVCWVDGKKICHALAVAIRQLGGIIVEKSPVKRLQFRSGGVDVVVGDQSLVDANKVVLCTGLELPRIDGLPKEIPQSRPVRGVNLIVDQSELRQQFRHLVKHHRGTLCPRQGGRLIVGTTYEAGEASLDVEHSIVEYLYRNAEPVLPEIRNLPLLATAAGLRPKIGDGSLRLGRTLEQPELYFSLSHAGAGFLRAPVVAKELADFILNGKRDGLTRHHISG